jgi:hypothetical protein
MFEAGVSRLRVPVELIKGTSGKITANISAEGVVIANEEAVITVTPGNLLMSAGARGANLMSFAQPALIGSFSASSGLTDAGQYVYIDLSKWRHMTPGIKNNVLERGTYDKDSMTLIGTKSDKPSVMRSPEPIDYTGIAYLEWDQSWKAGTSAGDKFGPYIGTSVPTTEKALISLLKGPSAAASNGNKQWYLNRTDTDYLNFGVAQYATGWAAVRLFDTNPHNTWRPVRLVKRPYTMTLKDPANLEYVNAAGVKQIFKPATYKIKNSTSTVANLYRDNKMTFEITKEAIKTTFTGYKVQGAGKEYTNKQTTDELVFNSDFIKNNQNVLGATTSFDLVPVYEVIKADVTVSKPDTFNGETAVLTDSNKTKGKYTYSGNYNNNPWSLEITWGNDTIKSRGYYNVGDYITAEVNYLGDAQTQIELVGFEVRMMPTPDGLKQKGPVYPASYLTAGLKITEPYVSIIPIFTQPEPGHQN